MKKIEFIKKVRIENKNGLPLNDFNKKIIIGVYKAS